MYVDRKRRAGGEEGRQGETIELKKPKLRTVGNAIYEAGVIEHSLMDTRNANNQRAESDGDQEHDGVYQNVSTNTRDEHPVETPMLTVTCNNVDDTHDTEYDTTHAGHGINVQGTGETDNVYNKLEADDDDNYGSSGEPGHGRATGDDTYNHVGDTAESNCETTTAACSTLGRLVLTDDVYSNTSAP